MKRLIETSLTLYRLKQLGFSSSANWKPPLGPACDGVREEQAGIVTRATMTVCSKYPTSARADG